MLKKQLPAAEKRAVTKLEKQGVLGVFDGPPAEERVLMIGVLINEGCTLKKALERVDKELEINVLTYIPDSEE